MDIMVTCKKKLWILLLLLVNLPLTLGGSASDSDNPALPRVLLIGDSISMGYTDDVREMLKGIANVHRPPLNCMYSAYVAENIEKWLAKGKWDVVHFNAGIWDCHFLDKNGEIVFGVGEDSVSDPSKYKQQVNKILTGVGRDATGHPSKVDRIRTSFEEYEKNLAIILDAIIAAGGRPVFATTTMVPRWNSTQRAHLLRLNEIAIDLMTRRQVQVNDLYTYSLPNLEEWQAEDRAHFTPLGYKHLAKQVSEEVLKALNSEAKILDWKPEQTSQETIGSREVARYEHECLKRWGYVQPHNEFFYVMKPNRSLAKNPLVVFLHSAGGNAASELEGNVNRVEGYGEEFVGLLLNSPLALDEYPEEMVDYDWWWGAKAIEKHPAQYLQKMTPIENRLLETVEWVIQNYNIDRNRVYLRGISMGGSGALGIGLAHGDIFAALQAEVFAGVEHAMYRLQDNTFDPPYLSMIFSHLDPWSKGAEQLLEKISTEQLGASYAWDIYGHDHRAHHQHANQFVVNFPWLSIRRDQAYPVFMNASSDDTYPGHMGKEPDQKGQKNAFFRWSVLEDTADRFVIELRLANQLRFMRDCPSSEELSQLQVPITADVTLRRLQHFKVLDNLNTSYLWVIEREGSMQSSGQISPNDKGLLTVKNVVIGLTPVRLTITETLN